MNNIDTTIKVSVVIPVYKPGGFFRRCLESIINQTLKEIEILVIDDQGKDDSIKVAEEIALKDNRVKIIKNDTNIGAGPSRNRGIEMARGEYLSFIDADDYVEEDYYELLYTKAKKENLDIVKGKIIYELANGTIIKKDMDLNQAIADRLNNKPLFLLFTYEHHSAIYKREIIINNNLTYGKSKRMQDTTFLLKVCLENKTFGIEENAKYHFCENETSAMHQVNEASLKGILDSLDEQIQYLIDKNVEEEYANEYVIRRVMEIMREYFRFKNQKGIKEEEFIKELSNIIKKYPPHSKLKEKQLAIKALLDYKVVLSIAPYLSPWERANEDSLLEIIKLWENFLRDHPENTKTGSKQLCSIVNYAKRKGLNTKRINETINKMPLNIRAQHIIINTAKSSTVAKKIKRVLRKHLFK